MRFACKRGSRYSEGIYEGAGTKRRSGIVEEGSVEREPLKQVGLGSGEREGAGEEDRKKGEEGLVASRTGGEA